MEMKKVLCIAGSSCDLIFGGLPELPAFGGEVFGTHFSMQAGGGANTPVLLARSGVPTSFWTLIGQDLPGTILRDSLVKSGVRIIPHGQIVNRTPVSAVLSGPEDRAFVSFDEGAGLVENDKALEDAIREADIVQTYLSYCKSYPILQLCERYGVKISLESCFFDQASEENEAILKRCDYWKGNETEAKRISGKENVNDALLWASKLVKAGAVITLGEKGSIGMERGGTIVEQPPLVCGPVRDTCGAGDAYTAGFLYGLSEEMPFTACMQLGASTAGQVVSAYGGCPENVYIAKE